MLKGSHLSNNLGLFITLKISSNVAWKGRVKFVFFRFLFLFYSFLPFFCFNSSRCLLFRPTQAGKVVMSMR